MTMATKILDNSFLFLKPTLPEVYKELNDPSIANIGNYGFIQLDPNEQYRQLSVADFGAAGTVYEDGYNFGGDYKVELVDCCGKFLSDVTPSIEVYQFIHQETGLYNMYWQITNLLVQYYGKEVHFKFSQPDVNSELILFSNPFQIWTDKLGQTVRFDYWDYRLYDGFDFPTSSAKLSIRVKGNYVNATPKTARDVYRQQPAQPGGQARTIHNASPKDFDYNYQCQYITNQGVQALESMFGMGVIYLNGERVTNITQALENVEGMANFYKATWTANLDRTEVYTPEGAIGIPFALINAGKQPYGSVTLSVVAGQSIKGFFNKNITIGTGRLIVTKGGTGGTRVAIYTQADISLVGSNGFEILDFIGLITTNGNYSINFTAGLFLSPIMETYATSAGEWDFTVEEEGDYDSADYDNTNYFAS